MNFIKKIFESTDGNINDELVHMQFQKFSKGEFRNRAVVEARKTESKCTISTSAEFANELVRVVAENLGGEKTNVTGAIVSTNDLKSEIEFTGIKQFQGVKRYLMDTEMSGDEIISLLEKIPKAFFALSFESKDFKLKTKPKAPKSGKPGKGEEAPKANFCKLITTDEKIVKDFVFEVSDFKKVAINHTFMIDEIFVSDELKKTNDFSRIREEAKRKGRILRNAVIDEKEIKSEKSFEA
ncbi:MAG: hypothetical protein KJ905_01875 [Nanoarchaeota archaeon]|nr:hypothetical protein [Nanoarchaeota archaeon]MBU1501502.1 hypothetical protein [Nanoarchaeota archaeon]MBU2459163.1 hypothetical protein [Nanoarchaeota archaeon]